MRISMYSSMLAASILAASCSTPKENENTTQASNESEVSSEKIVSEETAWEVLFDGTTLENFRNYKADTLSDLWKIEDGCLTLTAKKGGDIITQKKYKNFELNLEWKISAGGNSGIFFHVAEADSLKAVYLSGPEIQVLDNERHKDAKILKHRAGDNYDLISCSEETVLPAGEWNQVRLIVNEGHVEHWLNDKMVVEYQLGSPEWEELYQNSKFAKFPLYGQAGEGYIALQDHGDRVWYRNIKIQVL